MIAEKFDEYEWLNVLKVTYPFISSKLYNKIGQTPYCIYITVYFYITLM